MTPRLAVNTLLCTERHSRVILTLVKIPSLVFLLIIWTTPMTVPRMQIGMQSMELVV